MSQATPTRSSGAEPPRVRRVAARQQAEVDARGPGWCNLATLNQRAMKEDPNKMSTFVHMELSTSDVNAAKEFYQAIFGWQYHDMEMPGGSYTIVMAGEQSIGGFQTNPMPEVPNNWLGYVGVESVARAIEAVESHGGKVLVPETEVGGMGKLAVFTDPQGAAFAVWQSTAPTPPPAPAEAPPRAKKAAKKVAKKGAAKKGPAKKAAAAAKKAAKKEAPKKAPGKKAAKKKGKK